MKRFLLPALLTIAAFSGVAVDAQQWIKVGCNTQGNCYWVKRISRSGNIVYYMRNTTSDAPVQEYADCANKRLKLYSGPPFNKTNPVEDSRWNKGWRDVMPGSMGDLVLKTACGIR